MVRANLNPFALSKAWSGLRHIVIVTKSFPVDIRGCCSLDVRERSPCTHAPSRCGTPYKVEMDFVFFISLIAYYFYLWIDSVKVGRMLGNLMS